MRYHNSIPWITDASAHGLDLPISWDDGEAVLSLTMPRTSQAAPGVTHGGDPSSPPPHGIGFVSPPQSAGGGLTRHNGGDSPPPAPPARRGTIPGPRARP